MFVVAPQAVHAVDIVPLFATDHVLVRVYRTAAVDALDGQLADLSTFSHEKHVAILTLVLLKIDSLWHDLSVSS